MQERLYDAAALVLSTRRGIGDGNYRAGSELTSARRFAATLAGKAAAMAAG